MNIQTPSSNVERPVSHVARVLVVDDDKSIRLSVREFLWEAGYEADVAEDVQRAQALLADGHYDVVVSDIVLPEATGVMLLQAIRETSPDVQVIMMTGEPSVETAADAVRAGASDYLVKPVTKSAILSAVRKAAETKMISDENRRLRAENLSYQENLEQMVSQRTAELRALTARQHAVREEERKTLSRELHDNFGQNLTALQIDLAWLNCQLRSAAPPDHGVLCDKVATMEPLVKQLTELTQNISSSLRLGVLDDLGLVAAIEWQAEDFEKLTGLPCAAALPAEDLALDTDCALTLFRIMQEALTNVTRHAQARRVDIRLRSVGSDLELEIQDDGRGFTPDSPAKTTALGLLGMHERAAVFGGDVAILSAPGKGTTVRVRIPGRPVRSGGQL